MTRISHRACSGPGPAARPPARAIPAKVRLVHLHNSLAGPAPVRAHTLRAQLGLSPRQLRRDLQALRAAGVTVQYQKRTGTYHLAGPRYLPPLDLTAPEALGLLALSQHLGADPILAAATTSALAKIRSYLPAAIQDTWPTPEMHLTVRSVAGPSPADNGDTYCLIELAIRNRCALQCRYHAVHTSRPGTAATADAEFLFRPYHLLFSNRAWYVIGRRMDRRALRTLKLVRLDSVAITNTTFRRPRAFSLAGYLGKCWRMVPGKHRHLIKLRISADFAANVCETKWHASQQCQRLPDGTAELIFTVDGLDEIVWWILALGPHCQVLHPPALAQKVRDLAQQTARQYVSTQSQDTRHPAAEKKFRTPLAANTGNRPPPGPPARRQEQAAGKAALRTLQQHRGGL